MEAPRLTVENVNLQLLKYSSNCLSAFINRFTNSMIADITARFVCVSVNSSSSREVTGNLWKNISNIVVKQTQRWNDKGNRDGSGGSGVADEGGNNFYRNGDVDDDDGDDG